MLSIFGRPIISTKQLRLVSSILIFVSCGVSAQAQTNRLHFPRLTQAPNIEDFLQGPPDTEMVRVSGFVQNEPYDGEPSVRETIVFLGYDDQQLYVVFLAYDDAGEIRARLSQRENIWADDRVSVLLDTFNDQRRAYEFSANAMGVQRDRFLVEGQRPDSSYDAVWTSKGTLTDWGYVVWMALPFKSLRFSPADEQSWGLILERNIERLNEKSNWPHVSSNIAGRLNQAALATGIREVSPGKSLQVIPYSTSNVSSGIKERSIPFFVEDSFETKAGVDIKKIWDDRIVTDLTINPDFSQIESDRPQVTINRRYEVFFPERRPFFLENADVFRTPINLLFTRRIADPEIGARVTAKLGPWALGSFIIDDEAPGRAVPEDDPDHGERALFGTLRVNRDIGEQSRLGAMIVQRDFADESNRVVSVDGRHRWNDHWISSFQGVRSSSVNPGFEDTSGHAAVLGIQRRGRQLNYRANLQTISQDFEAAAGFIRRTDIMRMDQRVSYTTWPDRGGWLVSWGPEFEIGHVWDSDGKQLDEDIEAGIEWEFPRQTKLEINVSHARERLTVDEFPVLAIDREYDASSIEVEYGTSWWKNFSVYGETSFGKGINFSPLEGLEPNPVDWLQSNLKIALKPLTQLAIDTSLIYTLFENDSTGARVLEDLIARTRLNWQFSRELSLRSIIQFERTSPNPLETTITDRENWNLDLLLTYRLNPWTAVYFGYNTNRQNIDIVEQGGVPTIVRTSGLHKDSEQWLLKFSYLLRP